MKTYSFSLPTTTAPVLLALLLLFFRFPVVAQEAPAWQSAQAVATATAALTFHYSYVTATAVDGAGNVYVTGVFLDKILVGGTILTSRGGYDIFIAKFNPTGSQLMWAQRAGGDGSDIAYALAVSGSSVYLAGPCNSQMADFGPVALTNTGDYADVNKGFVAKLTDMGSTGRFEWVQRTNSPGGSSSIDALAVSGKSVYVAGSFSAPTAAFGPVTLVKKGAGIGDLFVAKLTDAGNMSSFVWAEQVTSSGYLSSDRIIALAVNGTSVYLGGAFSGSTLAFGPVVLTNPGHFAGFVAKLTDASSKGRFEWAQLASSQSKGNDAVRAVAVNGTSVYIAGSFLGSTASFGSTTLTNAAPALSEVFVAKLTDAGTTGSYTWAHRAGGLGGDVATAVSVSGSNIYVAGSFNSATADFGLSSLTKKPGSGTNIFVAKLTDAGSKGSFAWAQRAGGGPKNDGATAVAVGGTNVYVAGVFANLTAEFTPFSLPNNYTSSGVGFLASLTDPTLTATGSGEQAVLFPNPASSMATLRLPVGAALAPLTLTDALGRTVRRYPAPTGPDATLDLRGLRAGLYLLRGTNLAHHLVIE